MVDRQDKEDSPALLTRVTRRQATRSDASILTGNKEETAAATATVVKRPLKVLNQLETPDQIENAKKLKGALPQPTSENAAVARPKSLPTRDVYESFRTGRNPYLCVPCEKTFTRTSISSHVKSKHKGKNTKVSCLFCGKKFDRHSKAQDHVAAEHKVYACNRDDCDEAFSEFERLKAHLKSAHGKAEWPWICGFCDQIFFYDLEFQVHIKKHTEEAPYTCPLCDSSFLDTSKVTEHLAERHLPTAGETGLEPEPEKTKERETVKSEKVVKPEEVKEPLRQRQQQEEAKARPPQQRDLLEALARIRQKSSGGFATRRSESSDKMKDENAVNREIAALLLNLHASRGAAPKAEDLTVKTPPATSVAAAVTDSAMDLTKSKTSAATITKLVKHSSSSSTSTGGVDLTSSGKTGKAAANTAAAISQNIPNFTLPTTPANYPFYSSLATMASMTPSLALNSNYLLQNLLLGKMQQIVSASSGSTAPVTTKTSSSAVTTLSVPATSLPTQPLPAQSLTMQATNVSLKPPASVLKSTSVTASSGAPSFTNPMTLTSGVGGETTTTTVTAASAASIPLLCGQIVSQLNGLLFLVHGITNANLEINLQTQLTAINTRLQDIVTMVEHAKKSDPELNGSADKAAKEKAAKEEEKIVAKHIQDYQRALLKQHDDNAKNGGKNLVVDLPEGSPNDSMELQEAESTSGYLSAAARRRRGRPPKNSNLDLSYSPPEKQMKTSSSSVNGENGESGSGHQNGDVHNGVVGNGNGSHHLNGSAANGGVGGHHPAGSKSSKGIRNRVFCGECVGCLKNDDCGKCRYCKDKTKFGGQNRLRQKCLHRRCQMDTHRRRSSHNGHGSAGGAANSGDHNDSYDNAGSDIYSGVDLARLAAVGQQQQQQLAALSLAAAAAAKQSLGVDLDYSGENHGFDLRNGFPVDHHRSGSSASNGSDEDCDDAKAGKSQSRIDKWKAKHEAMLKLAQKTDKAATENDDKKSDKAEEMLNLDPASGVCIEFDRTKDVARKMANGRHNAMAAQQQVLSV